jgi:hypothetical protein
VQVDLLVMKGFAEKLMPERLRAAAERARNEGYLTPKNYQATIEAIERHEKA